MRTPSSNSGGGGSTNNKQRHFLRKLSLSVENKLESDSLKYSNVLDAVRNNLKGAATGSNDSPKSA